MTEQRRVVARVLSDSEDHSDVKQLYRRASKIDRHISIGTVPAMYAKRPHLSLRIDAQASPV